MFSQTSTPSICMHFRQPNINRKHLEVIGMVIFTKTAINTVESAKGLCYAKLEKNPDILNHTLGVVHNCRNLIKVHSLSKQDAELLLTAAYLHDIGHSEDINVTGFYQFDAYKHLLFSGWDLEVCSLVLHHSEARYYPHQKDPEIQSAFKKALPKRLEEVYKLLNLADMTSNSRGEHVSFKERFLDIKNNYGANNPLTEHASGMQLICQTWSHQLGTSS